MTSDPRAELIESLRALMAKLDRHDIDRETLCALADQVDAVRDSVDGPPRPRFYDLADAELSARLRAVHHRDHSLFAGSHNPLAPPMRFSIDRLDDDREMLVGEVTLDRRYEGPPRAVHGGYVAALFDEMLGGTMRFADGFFGVTGRLTIRYRKPTPIDTPLRFTAWVELVRGRRCEARAELHVDDTRHAEATGLFVKVPPGSVAR